MNRTPIEVPSIAALSDRFELFLFDQYGVLHDGRSAYPGLADTLATLKRAGRRTAVITNSGRSSAHNVERLARFGFGPDRVDSVLSSGELAQRELAALPRRSSVFVISRGDPSGTLPSGANLVRVTAASSASLVLIAGCDPERFSLDDYAAQLAPAVAADVPALCTNPDLLMLTETGVRFGPGELAAHYAASGGRVRHIGKPHPELYRALLDEAGVAPERTLCIGDSVAHDILGAQRAGCAALLVATGVHAGADPIELAALYAEHGAIPDFLLSRPS